MPADVPITTRPTSPENTRLVTETIVYSVLFMSASRPDPTASQPEASTRAEFA